MEKVLVFGIAQHICVCVCGCRTHTVRRFYRAIRLWNNKYKMESCNSEYILVFVYVTNLYFYFLVRQSEKQIKQFARKFPLNPNRIQVTFRVYCCQATGKSWHYLFDRPLKLTWVESMGYECLLKPLDATNHIFPHEISAYLYSCLQPSFLRSQPNSNKYLLCCTFGNENSHNHKSSVYLSSPPSCCYFQNTWHTQRSRT